jgi:coenzyme PQQ precursor peptide PqqA
MMFRFHLSLTRTRIEPVAADAAQPMQPGTKTMRWETPKATDFRFGMEITLYIAHR